MSGTGSFVQRLSRLRNREDFAAHPVKAIAKRVYYRIRSKVSDRPWTLTLDGDLRVIAPIISTPGTAIFYHGASEPWTLRLFKSLLRPGMVVADVGAHLGEYALVASRAVGERGKVLAFEPGEGIYQYLEKNIALNNAGNVTSMRFAVSDTEGEVSFNLGVDPGHSRLVIEDRGAHGLQSKGIVNVPRTTLEAIEATHNLNIDLIKIDVEGTELDVLKGSRKLLSRRGVSAPIILFEYLPRTWKEYGYNFEDGESFLADYGYDLYGHRQDGSLYPLDEGARRQMEVSELDLMILAVKPEHFQRFAADGPRVRDSTG